MQVYLCGGAVRDKLLGKTPKDEDFVVVGSNEKELLSLGFKRVGESFPVFLHPDTKDEWALARTERKNGTGYTGFEVQTEGVTLEDDLARRDFTINAMALDAKYRVTLVDPFGGQQDLSDGIIRHVTNAFKDDPLRVLRAARFAARYDFKIAEETLDAISQVPDEDLEAISNERILIEIRKVIKDGKLKQFFDILKETGHYWMISKVIGHIYGKPGIRCDLTRVEGTITVLMIQCLRSGGTLPNVDELQSHRRIAEHFHAYEQDMLSESALCKLISFLGKWNSAKCDDFINAMDVLNAPYRLTNEDCYYCDAMNAYWAINAEQALALNPSLEGKALGDFIQWMRLAAMKKFV
jgi:tRNA nucleotidyltransferase/poly(A) polymerase